MRLEALMLVMIQTVVYRF